MGTRKLENYLGPLKEQEVLLTAEPSLQPPFACLYVYFLCIGTDKSGVVLLLVFVFSQQYFFI